MSGITPPNETLFIQAGTFFASWAVMHKLVFKPYLKLIHARHAKTTGLKEKAFQEKEKAEHLRESYEMRMKDEKKRINTWLEEEKKKVSEVEKDKLVLAKAQATKEVEGVRKTVRDEVEKARASLVSQVGEYSSRIVTKLVGKTVSPAAMTVDTKSEKQSETRVET